MKTILLLLRIFLLLTCLSCNSKKTENQTENIKKEIEDNFRKEIKKIRPGDDVVFMSEFSQKELLDIELGKLSIKKAGSEEVSDFMKRLVLEHLELNENLRNLAKSKGITLPDTLEIISQVKLIELQELEGKEFDEKLLEKVIKFNKKDIKVLEKYRNKTKDKELIEWIDNSLLRLKNHLEEAQAIQSEIEKS